MKKKKILYYAEILGSYCLLVEASSIEAARKYLLAEYGRNGNARVSKATEENEASVKAMGGMVHEIY